MPENKNIVLFFDGTWQAPKEGKASAENTNVRKLFKEVENADRTKQVSEYFPGIGTQWGRLKHPYGITGYGLTSNVETGYRFIVENYVPGDRIFLFGFSRGAFTARTLAGMVGFTGILSEDERDRVQDVLRRYMNPSKAWPLDLTSFLRTLPAARNDDRAPLRIHFIGLWDTVAALGAPPHTTPLLKRLIKHWTERHTDVLPPHVTHARHALALHELRGDYEPVPWTGYANGQSLKQCWFAGNHSDVGGGYAETALSDVTLTWMAVEALACGLELNPGWTPSDIVLKRNLGGVHNEIQWFYFRDPTLRKRLFPASLTDAPPGLARSTYVHRSVIERLGRLGQFAYRGWGRTNRDIGRSLSKVDSLTMPFFLHHYFTQGNRLETG